MAKIIMWPKNCILIKICKTNYFEQKELWKPKLDPNFLWASCIVKLMAQAYQDILTFNPYIINYGRLSFLKLVNKVSLLQKKSLFSQFLDTKPFFAMTI